VPKFLKHSQPLYFQGLQYVFCIESCVEKFNNRFSNGNILLKVRNGSPILISFTSGDPNIRINMANDIRINMANALVYVDKIFELFPIILDGQFGVNVFFIISGFLITSLLLDEENLTGSISIKNFYIRRVLRIFPA
jgi:hypothetical protein